LAQMVSATVVFCTVETEGVAFAALSAVDPPGRGTWREGRRVCAAPHTARRHYRCNLEPR
jgi:hypothetical protein